MDENLSVLCECGNHYSLHMATVCPNCYQWPSAMRNKRVATAFDMIASANTVTILSLGEMESIVNRALSGEFDHRAQESGQDER